MKTANSSGRLKREASDWDAKRCVMVVVARGRIEPPMAAKFDFGEKHQTRGQHVDTMLLCIRVCV